MIDLDCRVKPGNDKKETSPTMTKKNKAPGNDKGKRTTKRKEFLLTILSTMLLKKKKRATRKLWHNVNNCSPRRARLWEETENE